MTRGSRLCASLGQGIATVLNGIKDTQDLSTADKNHFMLNRSRKNLRRDVGRAIADFDMIQDGDLVMVCLSGGKDSHL